MTKKSIFIPLFLSFTIVGSILLTLYVESATISDFLTNHKDEIQDDPHRLILTTAIVNANDGSDAFLLKEPLLAKSIATSEVLADISFYALGYVRDDQIEEALVILVNNFDILEDWAANNVTESIVTIELTFDQPIQINQQSKQEFIETMLPLYTDDQKLAIFEVSAILERYPFLKIESLRINYRDMNSQINPIVELSEVERSLIQWQTLKFSEDWTSIQSVADYIYDPSILVNFQKMDRYYLSHFSIYLLIVLSSAYFIFFRQKIRNESIDKSTIVQ